MLDDIADGDEDRLAAPDVASVFERFQQQVPFVALTTLQIRESVEKENGTLDAFVMEWQTYKTTDSLRSGFEFVPFVLLPVVVVVDPAMDSGEFPRI